MKKNIGMSLRVFLLIVLLNIMGGCAAVEKVTDESKGMYKVGKPYVISGKRYVPKVDYEYSETGLASWYGPGFHGKKTANGERFNERELTAAHRTLPMPSIVRVTNLDNGKSVMLRVNDRGPFSKNRIIDVSSRGAELLGFKNHGIAKVRVTIMERESKKIAQAAMQGMDTRGMMGLERGEPQYTYDVASMKNERTSGEIKLKTSGDKIVPGHITNGHFYPDQVVTQEEVVPTSVYIQVGAFASRENAVKLSQKLMAFGSAQIFEKQVMHTKFYRVRIPAGSPEDAVKLRGKIEKAGHKDALITVE